MICFDETDISKDKLRIWEISWSTIKNNSKWKKQQIIVLILMIYNFKTKNKKC